MPISLPLTARLALALAIAAGGAMADQHHTEAQEAILALEADAEAGAKHYKRECRGCHGPTAKGLASYPKLIDHPPEYVVMRLLQYRAGEKLGPNTPLMAPRAAKLSDQDIADLTAFIQTQGSD